MKSIDHTGSTETGTVNRSGACRSNHLRGVMRRLSSSSLSIVMFGVENPKHMQVVQGVGTLCRQLLYPPPVSREAALPLQHQLCDFFLPNARCMLQPDSAADLGDRGQKQHQTTSLVPTPNQPQNTQCSGTHQRLLPERKTQAYGQCRPLEFPQDLGIALSFRISLPIYIGSPYQSILHVNSEVRP